MRLHDVTLNVSETLPLYPGDPSPALDPWQRRSAGAAFDVSLLRIGTHSGTHVDAPRHCLDVAAGEGGVDAVPLTALCGPAFVLDLAGRLDGAAPIETLALDAAAARCTRLLLRTHDGDYWAQPATLTTPAGCGLSVAAARSLAARGVVLVGIDRLSIAPAGAELAVHQILLGGGVVIVEGLDLSAVAAGAYELYCLPLRLAGADGAPARAVLVERHDADATK